MTESPQSGGGLFIVDNSDENWKGLRYLQDWTEIASAFDVATGFFEIGSLLALDGKWQQLSKIRILMGDEMSARTRQALLDGLKAKIAGHLIMHERKRVALIVPKSAHRGRHPQHARDPARLHPARRVAPRHPPQGREANSCLRQVQAPVGINPQLKCWMEIN